MGKRSSWDPWAPAHFVPGSLYIAPAPRQSPLKYPPQLRHLKKPQSIEQHHHISAFRTLWFHHQMQKVFSHSLCTSSVQRVTSASTQVAPRAELLSASGSNCMPKGKPKPQQHIVPFLLLAPHNGGAAPTKPCSLCSMAGVGCSWPTARATAGLHSCRDLASSCLLLHLQAWAAEHRCPFAHAGPHHFSAQHWEPAHILQPTARTTAHA